MEYSLSHVSAARIRDKHWTRLSGQKMQKLSFFRDRLKPIGAAVAYTVIFALFTSIEVIYSLTKSCTVENWPDIFSYVMF